MKALRICRTGLVMLTGVLALALSVLVLTGFRQGFVYEQAMQGLLCLTPVCAGLIILLIAVLVLRARYEKPPLPRAEHAQPYREKEMPSRGRNVLRGCLMGLAVLLILLGILNGGLWDVLVKAVNICTECIGLG